MTKTESKMLGPERTPLSVTEDESCETCRFMRRASGQMICAKSPPNTVGPNWSLRQPPIPESHWCGEYQPLARNASPVTK